MTEFSVELLDSIHSAAACMVDIRALAEKLAPFSAGQIEPLLLRFADEGEDLAVSRLLQVCAFSELKLDPEVLCRCIGVHEKLHDSAPCFALQDESAVSHLLAVTISEQLPVERKLYAARLAAELSVKFDLDRQPVKKVLWKQEHIMLQPHSKLLIEQSLQILQQDSDSEQLPVPRWIDLQLTDLLPENRHHSTVGGTYTVRRPIPKLGRNEPCHCGSGKKYKKCCYRKDQEFLRDAS